MLKNQQSAFPGPLGHITGGVTAGGSYRLITPDEYVPMGIDPEDIPEGTFPAHNHPSFLHSRYGGNAFGFGLFEASASLSAPEYDFISSLDFENENVISDNYKQLNEIYKKMGLLVRFSKFGRMYFLIPINLVTKSLEDVKERSDEIEQAIQKYQARNLVDSLNIGIITDQEDLTLAELSGRLTRHRFHPLPGLDSMKGLEGSLDLVIVLQDIYEFFSPRQIGPGKAAPTVKQLAPYAAYLLDRIYNLLKPSGELFALLNRPVPSGYRTVKITFHNETELKRFLIFTHVFESSGPYPSTSLGLKVNQFDLSSFLKGFFIYKKTLLKLVGQRDPLSLTIQEIDALPYFNLAVRDNRYTEVKSVWHEKFPVFFHTILMQSKLSNYLKNNLDKTGTTDRELPRDVQIYWGRKRPPQFNPSRIKNKVFNSGLIGCPVPLLASYKNTFDYLVKIINTLEKVIHRREVNLPPLQLNRLLRPVEHPDTPDNYMANLLQLIEQKEKISTIGLDLNPDNIEGTPTPVLENLDKLILYGFSEELIEEILFLILGHTCMSRVAQGKIPPRMLKSVT
ncbi:MAG: hypothetical protein HQK58_11260, partial [Deltaproteobacteria bacterium]|nr:hypothetical protein [Deltaproteobacteria bacterium]